MNKPWTQGIREPAFSAEAPRQTVSLTINSDLFARVKALGINASRVAEAALAAELEKVRREKLLAEITADTEAVGRYVATHGSFGDLAREHYATRRDDKK